MTHAGSKPYWIVFSYPPWQEPTVRRVTNFDHEKEILDHYEGKLLGRSYSKLAVTRIAAKESKKMGAAVYREQNPLPVGKFVQARIKRLKSGRFQVLIPGPVLKRAKKKKK